MSDALLGLGLLSLGMLFVAGLLALIYQYRRNFRVKQWAIALGIGGGLGVVVMFGSLLFPGSGIGAIALWYQTNALAPLVVSLSLWGAIGQAMERSQRQKSAPPPRRSPPRRQVTPAPRRPFHRPPRPSQPPAPPTPPPSPHRPPAAPAKPSFLPSSYDRRVAEIKARYPAPHLMRKLNALTHDPRTSERLYKGILANNPDRSPDWAADRAIWQIERDRRG